MFYDFYNLRRVGSFKKCNSLKKERLLKAVSANTYHLVIAGYAKFGETLREVQVEFLSPPPVHC